MIVGHNMPINLHYIRIVTTYGNNSAWGYSYSRCSCGWVCEGKSATNFKVPANVVLARSYALQWGVEHQREVRSMT